MRHDYLDGFPGNSPGYGDLGDITSTASGFACERRITSSNGTLGQLWLPFHNDKLSAINILMKSLMKVLAFLLILLLMDSFSQSQSVDPLLTEDMIAELPLVKRPEAPCKTQFPLYSDKDKKPIWLDTTGLMKKVIHCEGPQFPPACKKSTNWRES